MDEESFLGALRKLNGISDRKAAKLFASLYKSELKAKKLEYELSQMNIEELENEIEQMKECIIETAKNNEDHQRRITSCNRLLGYMIVKPSFAEHFRMKRLIEKYKRKYETISRKVEENRKLLSQQPTKPHKIIPTNKVYQQLIDDYLKAENSLNDANQSYEDYEVEAESLAFSLADEISEYQKCAKNLSIQVEDFDPTKAIGGILGTEDQSDNDSYDES